MMQKGKWDFPSPSSLAPASCKIGTFCSMDYDNYCRLSYGNKRFQGRTSTGRITFPYDSDNEIKFPIERIRCIDNSGHEQDERKATPGQNSKWGNRIYNTREKT